ncbi:MAG: PAS domain S-box protein, partial [Euryarchaeota archaeon]|nr:PAS domain S-box protein [Euryarchaeota archaeon]
KTILSRFKELIVGKKLAEQEFTMINKQGKQVTFVVHRSLLRIGKKIIGMSFLLEDITERKRAENQIKASLKEKESLLAEIHHRVKNNMQIISSLLSLQSRYIKDERDLEIFRDSQSRVKSMSMIHEKLYQSIDFAHINFAEYILSLTLELSSTYKVDRTRIKIETNVEDVKLNIENAVPLGLIVNELLTNSIKHAFPEGHKGIINIELRSEDSEYELIISDDGVGLPEDIDLRKTDTLGLQLINRLVEQLDGTIELDKSRGTEFKVKFKEVTYKKRL